MRGIDDAEAAADALGYPCRLKLPLGGYDGRSQARIGERAEVAAAVRSLGGEDGRPLLLEAEIDFEAELSVILARDRDGRTCAFPPSRNVHDAGILAESVAPAPVDPLQAFDAVRDRRAARAQPRPRRAADRRAVPAAGRRADDQRARAAGPQLAATGRSRARRRPSSSSRHARSSGLPLGSVAPHGVAAMVNLLGTGEDRDARLGGVPDALRDPGVHLHVYGKRRVFERRKMGHLTVVGTDADEALARARRARAALRWEG